MYAAHFGLACEPFSLSPDPGFLYRSPDHAESLAALRIAIESRRGLTTLIGEVGTGKTTLLYTLLSELGPTVHTAYLANTKLEFVELLRQALADFGVPAAGGARLELLEALHAFLRRCDAAGTIAALVVDEAHNLDADTFEHLRLLTNFETYTAKLLQIVLVGQPELGAALARPELRQIRERVATRCHIRPLTRREARRYVAHRLACAGGALDLFTPAALALLVSAARGVPRRLNVLGHTALLFAYGRGARRVTASVLWAVLRARARDGVERAARPAHGGWQTAGWTAAAAAIAVAAVALRVTPPSNADLAVAAEAAAPAPRVAAAAPPVAAPASAPAPPSAALPPPPPRAAPAPSAPEAANAGRGQAAPAAEHMVIVSPGMTVVDIARRFYGDAGPAALRRIQAANPGLRDVDHITAGDVLRVPAAAPRHGAKGVNG